VPIGRWVLERACAQLRQWQLALPVPRPLYVSVNVSIRQLRERSFPMSVDEILQRTGLPSQSLVLEITEGLLADDSDAIVARLHELKALGLRIVIDDFGTGYPASPTFSSSRSTS
jgi:EAL domain-containing protein (putative c-di-GMP-specific phosphodiesterase class I)